jgi:hypothetical protein
MNVEQPLTGGNITSIIRVGDTVRRATGRWTAGVHTLLRHLEQHNYQYAPHVLGFDAAGREILTFVEGVGGFYDEHRVTPDNLWSDQVLVEAATALRALHDATVDFVPPPDAAWQVEFPDLGRHEVMCHNDFVPYNCIFRGGHLAGIIDFDTAGPGPSLWDVVYAAYRFVPLVPQAIWSHRGIESGSNASQRLRLLCDTYGLEDRHDFVDMLRTRIEAVESMLADGASKGVPGYLRILAEGGHLEGLRRDRAFIQQHRATVERWLTG